VVEVIHLRLENQEEMVVQEPQLVFQVQVQDMLAVVVERMETLLAEGKNLEEIQQAGITAGFDETWGGGWIDPSTFVEILYADLSRGDSR